MERDIGMRKESRKEEKNQKIYGVINTMSELEQKHAQNTIKIKWRCQKLGSEMFCFCFSNKNTKKERMFHEWIFRSVACSLAIPLYRSFALFCPLISVLMFHLGLRLNFLLFVFNFPYATL